MLPRMSLEKKLDHNQNKMVIECFRKLWDHSVDNMFLIEVCDNGVFKGYANNPACQNTMGLTDEFQTLGIDIRDVAPENLTQNLFDFWQSAIDAKAPKSIQDDFINSKGESEYWDTLVVPIFNEEGKASFICGVSRNITSIKQAQIQELNARKAVEKANEALHKLNDNLEEKVRERTQELENALKKAEAATEAKSNFLANMSHEIRTPMNAIIGLSRLSLRSKLNEEHKDNLHKILASSEDLLGLINDILDVSKIEAGKLSIESTSFNLSDTIQKALITSSLSAHEKEIELINYIAPSIPNQLIGDPLRLQQILTNLLSNAVKFTLNGNISVVATRIEDADGAKLQISVVDSGIGINSAQQQKVFKSFTQADNTITRKYGGTGLGLSICKQLINLMGGDIWVESEVNVGSTFNFTLPLQEDIKYQTPLLKVSKEDIAKLRVLIVDDTPLSRLMIKESLSTSGAYCAEAENGQQAITMVQQAAISMNPYDLVIMDWRMPKMSGIEASKIITEQNGVTPKILMVSAFDKDEAKAEAKKLNIDIPLFIEKPLGQSKLIDFLISTIYDKSTDKTRSQPPQTIPNLSGKHILLVEDNAINQQVAKGYLADTLVSVDVADNGKEALAMLASDNQYELVLMDIQMPVMDGLAAAKQARNELDISIPIIAMTAHAMAEDSQKSKDAGMNEHLTKPVDPNELYAVLNKYINTSSESALSIPQLKVTPKVELKITNSALLNACQAIKGLNVALALKQINGKYKLLEELIKKFALDDSLLEQLGNALKEEDYQIVNYVAHTLKSMASYIGATELSLLAAELEILCSKMINKDKINALSYQVNETYRQLASSIGVILKEQIKSSKIEFNLNKALTLIEQLISLSESGSIDAIDVSEQLYLLCQNSLYQDVADKIYLLVSDLDFEEAVIKLNELTRTFINENVIA